MASCLGLVDLLAAAVVAPAGIAFGIFVGQHRARRLEHGARHDVLRSDQLDLLALAMQLALQHRIDRRIRFGDALHEHRQRYVLPLRGNLTHDFDTPESLATRPAWRPPSNACGKEDLQRFARNLDADQPLAEGHHVGIVMLAREAGGSRVMREHRAHLGVAVGRDRDADPRAADQTPFSALPAAIASPMAAPKSG